VVFTRWCCAIDQKSNALLGRGLAVASPKPNAAVIVVDWEESGVLDRQEIWNHWGMC
jgi:hypothetical protein